MKQVMADSSLADKMQAYLQGHWPKISKRKLPASEGEKIQHQAKCWAEEITAYLDRLELMQKAEVIQTIASVWQKNRQNPIAKEYFAALKEALTGPWQKWQEKILNVHWLPHLRIHHAVDLKETDRFQFKKGLHSTHGAVVGSSFCRFHLDSEDKMPINSPILDSAFSAAILNQQGELNGFVLAVADGAGGHLKDQRQDRSIGRASYFACKQAARLLAALPDTKSFESNSAGIIKQINQTITRKTSPDEEGTTLVAVRGFWKPGSPTLSLIGFLVGDSLLFYWHPVEEKLYSLAPAQQWKSPSGQFATALLPNSYKSHEIYLIEQRIPAGGVFFASTDGACEYWPMHKKEKKDDQFGTVCTLFPDEKAISKLLSDYKLSEPISAWLPNLQKSFLQQQNQQREKIYNEAKEEELEYKKNLALLRAKEKEEKADDAGLLVLKKSVEKSSSKLTQSRMGDDFLMMAWWWPRILPSPIDEVKVNSGIIPYATTQEWKHPDLEKYEAELKRLREELKSQHEDLNEPENLNIKISALNDRINFVKKFPNIFYEVLRPIIEEEPTTEEQFAIQEDKVNSELELLFTSHQGNPQRLRELLSQRNTTSDTILTLALQSKCYRVVQTFLPYVPQEIALTTDREGNTLLDIIFSHRLVSDDLGARARSQAGLIKDLQSRGRNQGRDWLGVLQWHREPKTGCYPIHIAVQKAVFTQQLDSLKILLSNDPSPVYPGGPWMSQLQLVDGEGNTPLHVAIQIHAAQGSGLPVIEYLLTPQKESELHKFKNLLHATNRAGQTVFDLAEALYRAKPLWGKTIIQLLEQAVDRYRAQLVEWESIYGTEGALSEFDKENKYEQKSSFEKQYEELINFYKDSDKGHCQRLHECYRNFYTPILENDAVKMERMLEHISRHSHPQKYDLCLLTTSKLKSNRDTDPVLSKLLQELLSRSDKPIVIKVCADEKVSRYYCYGNSDGMNWKSTPLEDKAIDSFLSVFFPTAEEITVLKSDQVPEEIYAQIISRKAHTPTDLALTESFLTYFSNIVQELVLCSKHVSWLKDSLKIQGDSWRTAPILSSAEEKQMQIELGAGCLKNFRKSCIEESAASAEIEKIEGRIEQLQYIMDRYQVKANFYKEVHSRVKLVIAYRMLFNALGSVDVTSPMLKSTVLISSKKPKPVDDEFELEKMLQRALQHAKRLVADEKRDKEYPAADRLMIAMNEFGAFERKAEIVSAFDFKRVPEISQHKRLLKPLFHKPFSRLRLKGCHCTEIWDLLFERNTELRVLELDRCEGLRPEFFERLSKWCPHLQCLTIHNSSLSGFYATKHLKKVALLFPKLKKLELENCRPLTNLGCKSPTLRILNVHGCDQLSEIVILGNPPLHSIGSRQTSRWRSLQSDQKSLAPLSRELKLASQPSLPSITTVGVEQTNQLHRSAKEGELCVVRWLVEKNMLVNSTNEFNKYRYYWQHEKDMIK